MKVDELGKGAVEWIDENAQCMGVEVERAVVLLGLPGRDSVLSGTYPEEESAEVAACALFELLLSATREAAERAGVPFVVMSESQN